MARIRLQICVLPWEQPGPSPSSSAQTRQDTVKWCEPCTGDISMQEVCDRISLTWNRMFKPSMGPLLIRHLKTAYGEFVDLEERVVGDFFDDRKADGFIRNSILEVHRYPPTPDELQPLQRFSSLAPTSSARPSKRPLELPSPSYPSQNPRNLHREIPSIEEEWDAETVRPFGTATKRQRTQEPRFDGTSGAHQLFGMREERGGGQYSSSQTTGTQGSIHQVLDSQKSPRKKHLNPYGTPTSLPLLGPQEPTSGNEIDLSAIPDSPLGRANISVSGAVGGAMQLDRESTKSESPELRSSVHEVPPVEPIDTSSKQPTTNANSPKPSTTPFISNATSHLPTISQIVDENAKNHGLGTRQTGENATDVSQTLNHRSSIDNQAHAQTVRSSSENSHKSDPVFDPIESDTESFHEKQQMQSAKRLRSSKTPTASFTSSRGSNHAGAYRKDGQFLLPSVPQLHMNGAHVSEKAEEQQEKNRIEEKKAKEKRSAQEAIERENAAKKEAAERKANQERLANQKAAEEEKARVKELAQAEKAEKAKAKEEEFAEAKRNEASRADAARLAEEKKISERLAHERRTRETALAEEANKMMLAADGAKQIEAEKQGKEKARLREMTAKKQADEAKAAEQAREAQGKDHKKKARGERPSRDKPQQLADNESKDAKQRTHQARSAQETATALRERYQQKLRESSEVQSRSSTTPSASHKISGPKRSMTPFVPGTSANNSSHQSSLGSSPLSSRSSGNMDAPLRSALRQSSSAVPRSVSSVSFDVPPQAELNKYIASTPDSESLKAINDERATKQSSATNFPKNPPRIASNAPSKTSIKISMPTKASDSKNKKPAVKNEMRQTILNVTKEVKKRKGPAGGPPARTIPAPKQEIVLSSGEELSTSKEPKWQTGNAKAGPSSRKPIFSVTSSQGRKTAEVKASTASQEKKTTEVKPCTPIDPVIRNIKVEKDKAAAPATLSRSTTKPGITSLQKSNSRSPAQALSETYSLSSGSASNSDSDLESEDEEEEELQARSSNGSTDVTDGKTEPGTVKGFSKAVDVGAKQSEGHLQSKASSHSSQASSSRSRSTVSIHGDGKHVNQAADKQLQLESRQSGPMTNGLADNKVINQGLDHAGRLPDGIRPVYYKYPGLSELRKLPRAVTPEMKQNSDTFSSQPHGALHLRKSESDESSSDSDDSSSSSDGDEDVDGLSSQKSSKKKSGDYPGRRGLMKLANAAHVIRSKFGPG